MADQEMEHQDFTEDNYQGGDFQENGVNNGEGADGQEGDGGQDSGAADAPGRDDDRKLFVGGLSWETTEKELREYFTKFGPIESINVKTDPATGRSRGFAFLVFNSAETIDKIINVAEHTINGKKVDPKKAKARHGKIFVGGLKPELTDDEIKNFFSQYGTIVEVEMPFDKQKNQRKGFCFITFEQESVVSDLLKTPKQSINGHQVDVKKATPKPDQMMMRGGMMGGRGMRGARGGMRGRGRGGWGQGWNGGYGGYGGGYGGYGGGYDSDSAGYGYYDGYSGYGGYGGGGYGGYDYTGYGYSNYGPYQAGGKGTAGARATGAGGRRGTNRTETSRNFSSSSSQNANSVQDKNNTWSDSDNIAPPPPSNHY
ncbi:RNA-binding protein squid isoform X3 [Hyalella azteca]|uniref:RNA-binding protein squid isoform X3 n=1 Tax=Hyalella azteca TaxID=294128 RepID=A0A8B7NS75_HYAAZ|nr:RNA-binding protein squid isoform X3 [Hyalella azteca]